MDIRDWKAIVYICFNDSIDGTDDTDDTVEFTISGRETRRDAESIVTEKVTEYASSNGIAYDDIDWELVSLERIGSGWCKD